MNTTTITDAIDELDSEHGSYLYDVYSSGTVTLSYCPRGQQTAIPMGYVDPDEGRAKLDDDAEADVLERLMAGLGLTIDRRGQEVYDSGKGPRAVSHIVAHTDGDLSDEYIEASAVRLNRWLVQYLHATDADERPEGALDLKDRIDDVLRGRREAKENANSNRYEMGAA